jgi:hypothetical protein
MCRVVDGVTDANTRPSAAPAGFRESGRQLLRARRRFACMITIAVKRPIARGSEEGDECKHRQPQPFAILTPDLRSG